MNIQDYYKYSIFSTLAYVDWHESAKTDYTQAIVDANTAKRVPGASDGGAIDTLGEKIFRPDGDGWRIASFQPNDTTGFAASLFTNSATGEKVLSIRGTEPNGTQAYSDLLKADLQEIGEYGMAISQAVSLYNYVQRLRAPAAKTDVLQLELKINLSAPTTGKYVTVNGIPPRYISVVPHNNGQGLGELIKPTDNVVVTGHSLGGHLAAAAYRLFPGLFDAAVTFNAPGFDPLLGVSNLPLPTTGIITWGRQLTDDFITKLFTPNLTEPPAASFTTLPNMYSMVSEDTEPGNDTSIVSSIITGTPASPRQPITTERNSHMIEPLMDALAVQSLFEKMNPTIGTAGAGALVIAASNNPGKSEEELLDALSKLFLGNLPSLAATPNDIADGLDAWINPGDFVKRTTIHNQIIQLENAIKAQPGLSLTSLASASQSTLLNKAQQSDAEGLAYRYALKELNPFAVTGDSSLYDSHNALGELDLYDPATGTGNLTDLYLQDRAAMLTWTIKIATEDQADNLAPYYSDTYYFKDEASGTQVWLDNPLYFDPADNDGRIQMLFGGSGADILSGGSRSDHLYGGLGYDILSGGAGNDYLEGNGGDDAYIIHATDGNDIILDADGSGSIQVEIDGTLTTLADAAKDAFVQNRWTSGDGKVSYIFLPDAGAATGTLTVQWGSQSLVVRNYQLGQLGLSLADKPPAPPPAFPNLLVLADNNPDNDPVGVRELLPEGVWRVDGTPNNDIINGANGTYQIAGSGGFDRLYGGSGNDRIFAGAVVEAAAAIEATMQGQLTTHAELLEGGLGDDLLVGGTSNYLYGGAGSDTMIGGGNAQMFGREECVAANDAYYDDTAQPQKRAA